MSPSAVQLPQALEIEPRAPIDAEVRVPGSKSLTNRALLAAALADGESLLRGPLASDDTDRMRESLGAMGVGIDNSDPDCWRVAGTGGRLRAPTSTLDIGNAGTAARFLTAAATLAHGEVVLDGNERMRLRPISDLSDALTALGAEIETLGGEGDACAEDDFSTALGSGIELAAVFNGDQCFLQWDDSDGPLIRFQFVTSDEYLICGNSIRAECEQRGIPRP